MMAYAQALSVDRNTLEIAQNENDTVRCQQILQNAFRTDVRALVSEASLRAGGAINPIQVFRNLKVRENLIGERGFKTIATGL
jgi:L-rhamnose isomerase/sugar isomerase